jgi:putative oxidoreductase
MTKLDLNTSTPEHFLRARFALSMTVCRWVRALHTMLEALQVPAALLARLYVAQVFFSAGLTKLRDWETTLLLFTEEYRVPVLSPHLAAWLGTGGELMLPVLLLLGAGSRLAALGLSVVNLVAVLSLSEIAPAALQLHITWGVLLMGLALYGPGSWSLDQLLQKRRSTVA